MDKITFADFQRIMSYDITKNKTCIEVEFCVDDCNVYRASWLGKSMDAETNEPVYWFGLTEDGSQAYNYDSFESFADAKVFFKNSIKEVWDSISLLSIDACDIQERLSFYLS